MNRRDALINVVEALHAEIGALRANNLAALERATNAKLVAIEAIAASDEGAPSPEIRALAEEAQRLNETCRIFVNLMSANVRRRLAQIAGATGAAYRPGVGARACA